MPRACSLVVDAQLVEGKAEHDVARGAGAKVYALESAEELRRARQSRAQDCDVELENLVALYVSDVVEARCDAHGWRPAAISVRGDRLDVWTEQGLRVQYLGDEAIIEVASFHLDGRTMRPVRQAVSRTRRHGITTEVHREGDLDPTLRRALVGISQTHLDGQPDRGFSMALDGLLSGRDADCVILVARDDTGTPFAFQRYVPCRSGRGLSLDAMRRDDTDRPQVNGVNELMIVDAVAWAAEYDIDEVSLNFAAFKGLLEEDPERGLRDNLTAWFVRRLDPHFQIGSLLSFNAKFQPRWVPRYLIYRSAADFAPVGLAAATPAKSAITSSMAQTLGLRTGCP